MFLGQVDSWGVDFFSPPIKEEVTMKKLVILTAVFALVLGGTALAADWNFYGSARFQTFSTSFSEDANFSPVYDVGSKPLATYSYTATQWNLAGNARIGANVNAGDIGGRFEYGHGGNPGTSKSDGVGLRLLYGTWNFGSGELTVGQQYTPMFFGMSNSVYGRENGMAGFGTTNASRNAMLQLKFGGFKIGAVSPSVGTAATLDATVVAAGYTNAKPTLPKLEVAYSGAAGPVKFYAAAGYNAVDYLNGTNDAKTLTSYVLSGKVEYVGGPFTVGVSGLYGTNMTEYWGMWNDNKARFAGGDFVDTLGYGFLGVVGFKINDMLGVEAGYGWETAQLDSKAKPAGYKDDDVSMYYVQLPITLADGVFIVPEVGKIDMDKDFTGVKEGDVTYFGAKWQINF
jgi:hypothetical protein